LRERALSERWLFTSLLLTLITLSFGTLISGAIHSPMLPLVFAPTVVGFAAFARSRQSALLFAVTLGVLMAITFVGPLPGFAPPAPPWGRLMLLISSTMALVLLAVGVISLVDAHARIAVQLDRMRSDLLREAERRVTSMERLGAHVAHDVKNPLTAVRGLVQLVQRGSSERAAERLGVALGEIDRALDVLQDYLRWARPVRELELAETDVLALLEDVGRVVEARALEREVRLRIEGAPAPALIDRQRLRDALLNLALNALAAMPNGGQLHLAVDTAAGQLRIRVEDDGVGMDEAELARLGAPFASGREDGTGLGVLLAHSAVEQHGGTLHFESDRGRGTRATIELPQRVGGA
jgi:signal transduction histidine kinase